MVNKERMNYYAFLEGLRRSGTTNMFGAGPYLEKAFDELDSRKAKEILIEWMENYSEILDELVKNGAVSPRD